MGKRGAVLKRMDVRDVLDWIAEAQQQRRIEDCSRNCRCHMNLVYAETAIEALQAILDAVSRTYAEGGPLARDSGFAAWSWPFAKETEGAPE